MTWQDHAACRDAPSWVMFPARGESLDPARAYCAACPVRAECLDWALTTGQTYGVWGGTSERERRRMRRGMTIHRQPSVTLAELGGRKRREAAA